MICVDTTVLIDEFRALGAPGAAVNRRLLGLGSESLFVPVMAAGEFLDGAAMVSPSRFQEAVELLMRRTVLPADLLTAKTYGRIVSHLRREKQLTGRSQNDLWIAATALVQGARLLTRNPADFASIPGLDVLGY